MNRIIIKTYWNKVGEIQNNGWRKVLPEYELKSTVSYPDSRTLKEFMQETKDRFSHRIMEKLENGYKLNEGKWYGIHSYQVVTIEEVP